MTKKGLNKLKPKPKKTNKIQFLSILNTESCYALQTLRINQGRISSIFDEYATNFLKRSISLIGCYP